MTSWKEITYTNFLISFAFLISCTICITSFLSAHATDSGNDSNSVTDNSQIQNVSMKQISNATNFSNIKCSKGLDHVLLEGQFHNGDIAYKVIFLRMSIFDETGSLLTTGSGYISDVKPHEIKDFNAITRFNGNFSSCTVQIDNAIPK